MMRAMLKVDGDQTTSQISSRPFLRRVLLIELCLVKMSWKLSGKTCRLLSYPLGLVLFLATGERPRGVSLVRTTGGSLLPSEVFTFPGLFHMESMESIRYSMWIPWNHCWLRPQPIYCSMDIMDSMWNDHGMVNSIWNPTLFHMDSTGFHMEFGHIHLGFYGTSPYGFRWHSIWKIPWYLLSKIVSSMRIEHSTLRHITCVNERTL